MKSFLSTAAKKNVQYNIKFHVSSVLPVKGTRSSSKHGLELFNSPKGIYNQLL